MASAAERLRLLPGEGVEGGPPRAVANHRTHPCTVALLAAAVIIGAAVAAATTIGGAGFVAFPAGEKPPLRERRFAPGLAAATLGESLPLRSLSSGQLPVFIHVPMNGGTSIELLAAYHGARLGMCAARDVHGLEGAWKQV